MRLPLSILASAVALVAVVLTASNALGHARLKESAPAVGEVLQASPARVSITFSNEIQKITGTYGIDVADKTGTSVISGSAMLDEEDRSLLAVDLRPDLAPGRYVVQYKNVSDADGDPFEGGFAFYVGVEPTAEQRAADAGLKPEEATTTPALATPTPTVDAPTPLFTSVPAGSGDRGGSDDNGTLVTLVFVGAAAVVLAVIAGVVWRASRAS